jgi:hypothetical protein
VARSSADMNAQLTSKNALAKPLSKSDSDASFLRLVSVRRRSFGSHQRIEEEVTTEYAEEHRAEKIPIEAFYVPSYLRPALQFADYSLILSASSVSSVVSSSRRFYASISVKLVPFHRYE